MGWRFKYLASSRRGSGPEVDQQFAVVPRPAYAHLSIFLPLGLTRQAVSPLLQPAERCGIEPGATLQPERWARASQSATSARRRSGCSWGSAWPASSTTASEACG
jgi:hypothetical protein